MKSQPAQKSAPRDLADDVLHGADAIAKCLFGPNGNRRSVYHLNEYARLPVFRIGTRLCARRSVLMKWIAEQENKILSGLVPAEQGQNPVEDMAQVDRGPPIARRTR